MARPPPVPAGALTPAHSGRQVPNQDGRESREEAAISLSRRAPACTDQFGMVPTTPLAQEDIELRGMRGPRDVERLINPNMIGGKIAKMRFRAV
jgi:hypothetical protein